MKVLQKLDAATQNTSAGKEFDNSDDNILLSALENALEDALEDALENALENVLKYHEDRCTKLQTA